MSPENVILGGHPYPLKKHTDVRQKTGSSKERFLKSRKSLSTAVVDAPERESDSAFGFDQFWARYPRHINRPGALKLWKEQQLGDKLTEILEGLEHYRTSKSVHDKTILGPVRWLSEERWTDRDVQPAATENQQRPINRPRGIQTQADERTPEEQAEYQAALKRMTTESDRRGERWEQQGVAELTAMNHDERAALEERAHVEIRADRNVTQLWARWSGQQREHHVTKVCVRLLVDRYRADFLAEQNRRADLRAVV